MIRRLDSKVYKCAVIFYHKNISSIYKKDWIDKSVASIEKQTFKQFDSWELNYGNDRICLAQILDRKLELPNLHTIHKPLVNHVDAMNYLLDRLFKDEGYDVVFNTNLDDTFHHNRFLHQIEMVRAGYDLVSSNFFHVKEIEGNYRIIHSLNFSSVDIRTELLIHNHNICCHPVICFTKNFWEKYGPYTGQIPTEDLTLWKYAVEKGAKIGIVPEYLCNYLIHDNQITAKGRQ